MCRTFQKTYTLCLHTLITHHPCPKSKVLRIFSLFTTPHKNSTSKITINDFCPSCRAFWHEQGISDDSRRELANSFRIQHAYYGGLTPGLSKNGGVRFEMDGFVAVEGDEGEKGGEQVSDPPAVVADIQDNEVTRLSMINANYWAIGDEDPLPSLTSPESQSGTGPSSSKLTVWPSIPDGETNPCENHSDIGNITPSDPLPSPTSLESQSRPSSPSSTLTVWPSILYGMTSPYGNDSGIDNPTLPEAAHLASQGLIHPDAFEIDNLDDALAGSVDAEGLENQSLENREAPFVVVDLD